MSKTIKSRIINNKRHTIGYVLSSGQKISRSEAVQLAKARSLFGVRAVRASGRWYIQSSGNKSLYSLPVVPNKTKSSTRSSRRKASR